MTNQIQTQYFLGKPVRYLIDEKQNPWFLAMDVADILEYFNTEAMTKKLDEDEFLIRRIDGLGNRGNGTINESGLYSSILSCEKPQAKPFKKWVTNEVLPSIRKYGGYGINLDAIAEHFNGLYDRIDAIKVSIKELEAEKKSIEKTLRLKTTNVNEMKTLIHYPNDAGNYSIIQSMSIEN